MYVGLPDRVLGSVNGRFSIITRIELTADSSCEVVTEMFASELAEAVTEACSAVVMGAVIVDVVIVEIPGPLRKAVEVEVVVVIVVVIVVFSARLVMGDRTTAMYLGY